MDGIRHLGFSFFDTNIATTCFPAEIWIAVEYQNMVQTKTIRNNDVPQLGFDSLSGTTKLGFMPKMCGSGFIHQPNEQII